MTREKALFSLLISSPDLSFGQGDQVTRRGLTRTVRSENLLNRPGPTRPVRPPDSIRERLETAWLGPRAD